MANYGALILNDTSKIQICSKNLNLCYYSRGNFYIPSANAITTLNYDYSASNHLLTFKAMDSCHVALLTCSNSYAQLVSDISGVSIPYMIYRDTLTNAVPTKGMVFWSPTGSVAFSSVEKYFKAVGFYSIPTLTGLIYNPWPIPVTTFLTPTITVINTDSNFFLTTFGAFAKIENVYENFGAYYKVGIRRVNSTTIEFRYVPFYIYSKDPNVSSSTEEVTSFNNYIIEVEPPPGV